MVKREIVGVAASRAVEMGEGRLEPLFFCPGKQTGCCYCPIANYVSLENFYHFWMSERIFCPKCSMVIVKRFDCPLRSFVMVGLSS